MVRLDDGAALLTCKNADLQKRWCAILGLNQ
jgi:hypothetical protein